MDNSVPEMPENNGRTLWYCSVCGMVRDGGAHDCTLALRSRLADAVRLMEEAALDVKAYANMANALAGQGRRSEELLSRLHEFITANKEKA